MRAQVRLAREVGCDTVMTEPMIAGVSNFHALTHDFPDMAFIAHPALAGASRIHPPLLLGKLFRLFGADATIFPNTGGRFGYTAATCHAIADAARAPWHALKPCLPTPAGGMTLDRVPELLDSYGADTMLLIGGGLLGQHDRLKEAAREFSDRVAEHGRQYV
jgi:ribulose-bisphosphate carboxylase large chain